VWPFTTWMKNIHDDLSSLDLGIYEDRELAQNRPLWRLISLHAQCYALVVVHATIGLESENACEMTLVYVHTHTHTHACTDRWTTQIHSTSGSFRWDKNVDKIIKRRKLQI